MTLESKKRDVKEIVSKILQSGGSYIQAAEKLSALGFTTTTGTAIARQHVSYFMRSHGTRIRTSIRSTRRTRTTAPQAETTKVLPAGVRMVDIEEVVTSNLTDKLKLITISALMKG